MSQDQPPPQLMHLLTAVLNQCGSLLDGSYRVSMHAVVKSLPVSVVALGVRGVGTRRGLFDLVETATCVNSRDNGQTTRVPIYPVFTHVTLVSIDEVPFENDVCTLSGSNACPYSRETNCSSSSLISFLGPRNPDRSQTQTRLNSGNV